MLNKDDDFWNFMCFRHWNWAKVKTKASFYYIVCYLCWMFHHFNCSFSLKPLKKLEPIEAIRLKAEKNLYFSKLFFKYTVIALFNTHFSQRLTGKLHFWAPALWKHFCIQYWLKHLNIDFSAEIESFKRLLTSIIYMKYCCHLGSCYFRCGSRFIFNWLNNFRTKVSGR